ncbi:MAG: hypothetical protein KDC34_09335 [Saprospiraceae bacterium]|nr:hypothetical protein [Saprospiraceae bacterium]
MEKNKRTPEQEAEQTLALLEHIRRPAENPYLYTRVREAMMRDQLQKRTTVQWVFALATILIILNGLFWLQSFSITGSENETLSDVFAQDYEFLQPIGSYEDDLDLVSYTMDNE